MITIILFIISGICFGLMDAGTFYQNPKWMAESLTWTWKYINNDPSTKKYKWYGLAQFIVPDYWHNVKLLALISICSGVYFYKSVFGILDIPLFFFSIQIPFQIMMWILKK